MKEILKNKILQEILIYFTIVILLALKTHNDLLGSLERFNRLWDTPVLFGMFHPLVYGLFGYIIFIIIRGIFRTIKNIFT